MERKLNQINGHAKNWFKGTLMVGAALLWTLWATQACVNNNKWSNEQTDKIETINPINSDESLDGYITNLERRRSELKASIKSEQNFVKQETERQSKEGNSENEPSPEFYVSDTYYSDLEEVNTIDYCLNFYNNLINHIWKPAWVITTNLAIWDASDIGEVQHVYFTKEEYDAWQKSLSDETSKNRKEREKMMNDPNTEDYSIGWWELEIKEKKNISCLTNDDIHSILVSEARSFNNSLSERELFGELAFRLKDKNSTFVLNQDNYNSLQTDINKSVATDGTVVQSYNIKEDIK